MPKGLSSPQLRFTSVFGMRTGVSIAPNHQNIGFNVLNQFIFKVIIVCYRQVIVVLKFPNRIDELVLHGSTPYGAYT